MKKSIPIISILITLFLISCCNKEISKSTNATNKPPKSYLLKSAAQTRFGNNYKIVFNQDGNYALCTGFDKTQKAVSQTKFFIFDVKENKITFEDNVVNGEVNWAGKYKIVVKRLPGIVQKFQKPAPINLYFYNVITQKKSN